MTMAMRVFCSGTGAKREHRIVRRQKQCVSIAARDIFDLSVGLSLILFKCQRKAGIAGLNSSLCSRRSEAFRMRGSVIQSVAIGAPMLRGCKHKQSGNDGYDCDNT